MPSVADMRAALATALERPGVQVSAYQLWNPTPPTLYVEGPSVLYDGAHGRGHDDWTFTVTGLIATVSDIGSQKQLDEMIDPSGATSVKALLEADKTLGNTVFDVIVTACEDYQAYRSADLVYLGAKWTVEIMADGR